jgi:hypothetical protein
MAEIGRYRDKCKAVFASFDCRITFKHRISMVRSSGFGLMALLCDGTVRHMHAAAVAATPDYRALRLAISKGNIRGERAMYIWRTATLLKSLFFSP